MARGGRADRIAGKGSGVVSSRRVSDSCVRNSGTPCSSSPIATEGHCRLRTLSFVRAIISSRLIAINSCNIRSLTSCAESFRAVPLDDASHAACDQCGRTRDELAATRCGLITPTPNERASSLEKWCCMGKVWAMACGATVPNCTARLAKSSDRSPADGDVHNRTDAGRQSGHNGLARRTFASSVPICSS